MKKPRLTGSFIACFIAVLSLSACAQSHRDNTERLKYIHQAVSHTVLLNNATNVIPFTKLAEKKIASINLGFKHQAAFDSLLNKYAQVTRIYAAGDSATNALLDIEDNLKYYNTIVVALSNEQNSIKYLSLLSSLAQRKKLVLAYFGNGNQLGVFNHLAVPIAFCTDTTQIAATTVPQQLFGGIAFTQILQQSYSPIFLQGAGYKTQAIRLKYTVPEDANVNTQDLAEVDDIVAEAISAKAFPGAVVMAVKDGKVIFNKAYGYHTYNHQKPNQVTDIFDIASITKTTATTPAVMRLVENGKLNLDTNLGHYIAKARTLAINPVRVREAMLHQAGFIPYIPFHDYVKPTDYRSDSSALYNTKVADGYYIRNDYFNEVMWPKMLNTPLQTRGKYAYSDISMYVMQDIVERLTETPLDKYTLDSFYRPLGMQTAGFLPRNRFAKERIIPTENDTYFRKTLLEGYVHDQGAALKGGVAGHAGLFASANDLAIFYQMLLNKGNYGAEQYFNPQTVTMFTSKQSNISRRGLGFDRWDPDLTKKYPSELASAQTFGHTGYTGTCVWVDPQRNLVYILLSNRVNPQVSEQINRLGIRRRIQDVFNNAIDKGIQRVD